MKATVIIGGFGTDKERIAKSISAGRPHTSIHPVQNMEDVVKVFKEIPPNTSPIFVCGHTFRFNETDLTYFMGQPTPSLEIIQIT